MIKNNKIRFILTSLMLVMLLLFAFKITVNADTSAQWQLRADDYYYWIGTVPSNGTEVEVKVPSKFDINTVWLEYKRFENNQWISAPELEGFGIPSRNFYVENGDTGLGVYYTNIKDYQKRVISQALDESFTDRFRFKNPIDNISPIINGETNYITNVNNPVTEATIKGGLSANDNKDGYMPSTAFVKVSDTYTANRTKTGTYLIRYSITDSSGNTSYVNVNVQVVDVTKPTITGQSSYTIEYNQTQSLTTVKNNLTVSDNYDQSLTATLITDNYTANRAKKGAWAVTYQATDTSGNKSDIYTVTINVVDTVKPTISGLNNYTQVYNNKLELSTIKAALTANDGYDGVITSSITLKSDNYTANYNKLGTYQVIYTVKDSSNNSVDYTVTVKVIDNIKPTISGTNTYSTGTKVKLSESTIRQAINAVDGYDGALTLELVEDNYTSRFDVLGDHTITYKATDSSGNFMEYTVTVTVGDDIPPVIYVTNHFINVDGALNYTLEQIIEHLISTGQMDVSVMSYYSITANNYMSAPGNYEVTMTRNEDAPSELDERITVGIKVYENGETPPPVEEPVTEDPEVPKVDDENKVGTEIITFFKENWEKLVIGLIILIAVLAIARAFGFGRRRYRRF